MFRFIAGWNCHAGQCEPAEAGPPKAAYQPKASRTTRDQYTALVGIASATPAQIPDEPGAQDTAKANRAIRETPFMGLVARNY